MVLDAGLTTDDWAGLSEADGGYDTEGCCSAVEVCEAHVRASAEGGGSWASRSGGARAQSNIGVMMLSDYYMVAIIAIYTFALGLPLHLIHLSSTALTIGNTDSLDQTTHVFLLLRT
jgi:hypothetical protein